MSEQSRNDAIDELGQRLADAALTIVVRACREEVKYASKEVLEAATAAMRAQAKEILDRLIKNVREAPWISEYAFRLAALELAEPGIAVLRGQNQNHYQNYQDDAFESSNETQAHPVG